MSDESTPNTVPVEYINKPAPKQEAAPEVVQEAPKPDKFAKAFTALSNKEKAIYEQQKQIKEAQEKLQQFEEAKKLARTNPEEFIKQAGFQNLEDMLEVFISGDQPKVLSPEEEKWQKAESYFSKIDEYEKLQEEQELQEKQRHIENLQTLANQECQSFIENNSDKYELIHEYNAIDDVMSVIKKVWVDSNQKTILSYEEAADAVEQYLLDEKQKEFETIKRIKKLAGQNSLNSSNDSQEARKYPEVRTPSTLTNNRAVAELSPPPRMTNEQSLAEAAKLLRWDKK